MKSLNSPSPPFGKSDMAVHDQPSDNPTAERRDEVIRRMLATPPQPNVSPKKKKKASSDAGAPDGQPET